MIEKEINGFMIVDEPDEDVPRLERKIVKKKLIKSDNLSENKRFIALDEGYDLIIRDTITHNDLCDVESIIDVLNDYEKENEQLRQVMGFLQNDNTHDILAVLNSRERTFEQLTQENQQYKILTDELKRQNKKLKARLNDLGVEYYD